MRRRVDRTGRTRARPWRAAMAAAACALLVAGCADSRGVSGSADGAIARREAGTADRSVLADLPSTLPDITVDTAVVSDIGVDAPPADSSSLCPGGTLFTIDGRQETCGCGLSTASCPSCVSLGTLGPGTYRVEYVSGAIRTNTKTNWNRHTGQCSGCSAVNCWQPRSSLGELPGFDTSGQGSANAAEIAAVGSYVDYKVTTPTPVVAWYQDNVCTDNEGAVVYCIRKLSSAP